MTAQEATTTATTDTGKLFSAQLLRSIRLTSESSPEEVRELRFRTDDPNFRGVAGQLVRVMAPGQFGNRYHPRFYSLADTHYPTNEDAEFTLCVQRCFLIDDFNGEEYAGVASNYLCDLPIGSSIEYAGPVGYPFAPPADRSANVLMIGMGTGIAPFRGLVRAIYQQVPHWEGKVRLFYGARSGLEMLYMNDANSELGIYLDQPTFKAFQAISPRPALNAPVELDKAIENNAAEVWAMLQDPDTHVYIAGSQAQVGLINTALQYTSGAAWPAIRKGLAASQRWHETLY